MEFYPGFDIESREKDMEFVYGPDVFGPKPEKERWKQSAPPCRIHPVQVLKFFTALLWM